MERIFFLNILLNNDDAVMIRFNAVKIKYLSKKLCNGKKIKWKLIFFVIKGAFCKILKNPYLKNSYLSDAYDVM